MRVAVLFFFCASAFAQQRIVVWSEDFEQYGAASEPERWLDASTLFRISIDPAAPSNIVYGAKHPSRKQRSMRRRAPGDVPELGATSTLAGRTFIAGDFEYRGRFRRATADSLLGFTFFSRQPEVDAYRLIALWRDADDTTATMRVYRSTGVDDSPPVELRTSDFTPAANVWYRFAIRVDRQTDGLAIRARFWRDGEDEPDEWTLTVVDPDSSVASGRIGLWSANGAAYFDDLSVSAEAEDEADHTPPAIVFSESGQVIPEGATEAFNRDARIDVRALDGSGIQSLTVTLDATAYTPLTPIATEKTHVLRARAVDNAGNAAESQIAVIVDKTPPVIRVVENDVPMPDGLLVNRNVAPSFTAEDQTETTLAATVDGQPFASGASAGDERAHRLVVTATDAVGWTSSVTRDFVIDRTPPVIVFSDGAETLGASVLRNRDTSVGIAASDANGVATLAATLGGAAYTPGTLLTAEGAHALAVTAVDRAGNPAQAQLALFIDKTPPVVTVTDGGLPLRTGLLTKANVTPRIAVSDLTETNVEAKLNDAPFTTDTPVDAERQHTLIVTATDAVGWKTTLEPIVFTIDRTPPAVTITSPTPEQRVGASVIDVTGASDDAVRVLVNGVEATIDAAAKTFTRRNVQLLEGANAIAAIGTDAAGNDGRAESRVHLDTRAPELLVAAPASNACLSAAEVVVRGTMRDAKTIKVRANDGPPVNATITGTDWTATVPLPGEGSVVLLVEAADEGGHTATLAVPVSVDRTKPAIAITEGASPLTATLFNRPLSPLVRVTDAGGNATLNVTLNGEPYAPGTVLRDDATYVLRATATDCAGNVEAVERTFTIDLTPPRIETISPADGATVGNKPPLTGTLSEPATLVDEPTGTAASVDGVAFTIADTLTEGLNERLFVATDRAGNVSRTPYSLRVKTAAPLVEIVEDGSPIPAGALFNRVVVPIVRVNDPSSTVSATLNGQPFTSGTAVSADASYTLDATATDAFGHVSDRASATFTIDRTPPRIDITSPAESAVITGDTVPVRGTVDAGAVRVSINGTAATLDGTSFTATVLLEHGANLLTGSAVDAAGNTGRDRVEVTREGGPLAIILTSPPDEMLTNRPTTVVAGHVLTSPPSGKVNVNGIDIPVAAGGTFRKVDFALVEGENDIVASVASATGEVSSVSVDVNADFTPPVLLVTANALALAEGARFATSPRLAVEATDNVPQGLTTELTIDGGPSVLTAAGEIPTLADGGHALTAIARDAAGNETRTDRTFFIGESVTATGCALSAIDPPTGAAVFTELLRITGRSGGALGVLINGKAAQVADGSFCGEASLLPGRNEVVIRCADASGTPTSDPPVTIIVYRDVEPAITITAPATGATVTTSTITVTGTAGLGVVSGDVNGLPFQLPLDGAESHPFTVANVALSPGLNTIIARAKTGAGRTAIATARVTLLNATPHLAITSPIEGTETGASSVDVTGTYVHLDRATIAVNGTPAETTPVSATAGTFRATASLNSGVVNTISAGGRNHAGIEAQASVDVQQVAGAPSINITSPADNTYFASTTSDAQVTGTFTAAAGSQVAVNGVLATVNGTSFTATVPLGIAAATPIVARVTTPASDDAMDAIRVIRFAAPLALRDSFPSQDATGVDRGVALILLFNNTLDASTVAGAIGVTDGAGANVPGELFVDRDAVTFAPNEPLKANVTYTIAIATSLKDAAGAPLASAESRRFTTAGTAPAAAPVIDDLETTGCLTTITMTGRASTPGARVRLDADGVTLNTVASDTGAFRFTFSFSGQSGFHIARVREFGSDGSLSSERALCFRVNCELPRVIGAALDRAAKKLTIDFSRPMDATTLVVGGTILFEPSLAGTIAFNGQTATVSFAADVPPVTITLTVKQGVKDVDGASMAAGYTQAFTIDTDTTERGKGYVTGAVYDATTGRPLAGASVAIAGAATTTNDRGRYSRSLSEGAYTIEAGADGYTSVWRQIVVPAGAGVVPIDIRLTRRGAGLTDGGDTSVTRRVELTLDSASVPPGSEARVTSIGAQSLAGLLPLGWSPLASAEVAVLPITTPPLSLREGTIGASGTLASAPAGRQASSPAGGGSARTAATAALASDTFVASNAPGRGEDAAQPAGETPAPRFETLRLAGRIGNEASAPLPGARLTFHTANTSRPLTLVQYDSARDEWRVVASAVAASDGRVVVDIAEGGHYALVYPDAAAHLAHPPPPGNGDALQGVIDRCIEEPAQCTLTSRDFTLEPRSILPNGRAVATLTTEGATQIYPSGTAVQAFIDEQLNLSDGRVLVDPPFATDLLLYRTLAGDAAVADFHLAPTPQAAAVLLRDGVEHIRFVEYPGRLDRGTLLGAEGGRVPGDGGVTITVPSGATSEPLHAAASTIPEAELGSFGTIAGFRIAGGFTLALTRASDTPPADGVVDIAPSLVIPARATFLVTGEATQVIVAEVLPRTPYGVLFRLVAIADAVDVVAGGNLFATRAIDSTQLPVDGIVRDGRYLVLVAESPIAYAFGLVRSGGGGAAGSQPAGPAIADARVTSGLGIHGLTTRGGLFVLPVPSKPASPFSLTPRSLPTGDGATVVASTAPDAGAFVDAGVLPLVAQPPVLRSVTPDGGEIPITAALVVRAEFDTPIDAASVANGIRVMNLTTATELPGSVAAAGNSVTFTAGDPLSAASQYSITIASTIRGANGAPFGQSVMKSFRTAARPSDGTVRPERIRITIPDANGHSFIHGTAGALPAGAQAVAVRRGRDFIVRYQATVAGDGSFSFSAGHEHPSDRISTDDLIDLQVIDAVSRGIIAVVELTPFAADDRRSFIAPVGRDTVFLTADGIRVRVPAGAFDIPTLITVTPSTQAAFAGVPKFADELGFGTAVELRFDGIAKKRIDLDLPVPEGLTTAGHNWYVGQLGQSIRGPRVMIVDLAFASDGRFFTGLAPAGGGGARNVATNAALTGPELRDYLLGVGRSGIYALVDFQVTAGAVGFGILSGIQAGYDLFWDTLESLYAAHFYLEEGRGRIAIPVVMGRQFQIVGVDASTGLEAFAKVYDPIPIGDPGTTVALPTPNPDTQGPYPILGSPFRVEALDLNVQDVAIDAIRDFTVTLQSSGNVLVETTLPAAVNVTLMNVSSGRVDASRTGGLEVPGALGDRIVLLVGAVDVDPYSTFSIVFNEPIDVGTDPLPFFRITLDGQAITLKARVDSERRVVFESPASLQRGGKYRLEISPDLADKSGLRIGQVLDASGNPSAPLTEPLYLDFRVREPGGKVGSFDLGSGVIRDQALNGNVLLVSALEGGIVAYDISNPAGLTATTAPVGHHQGGITSYWALATDHHGRIYATGMTPMMGVVRSFRLEDFVKGDLDVQHRSAGTVSFVPGAAAAMNIASRVIASDRPEAIPRKLQVLMQDREVAYETRQELKDAGATVTNVTGTLEELRLDVPFNPGSSYAVQRVTVENLTLDMRWSADAMSGQPARIEKIVGRANDRFRVIYNDMTYGVVSLLGYGIAVLDLNAIESNDAPVKPSGYENIRELVRLTSGKMQRECGTLPEVAIPDLSFIPDAAIRTVPGSGEIQVFALDPHRGVLDLLVEPPVDALDASLPPDAVKCDERMSASGLVFRMAEKGFDHPRLKKLRELYEARTGRAPFGRFNAAAPYAWRLEAKDNHVVTPATLPGTFALGERGSLAGERVTREYILIPANEYGLLVVEIGGDAPMAGGIPGAPPFTEAHLVDVIWIPHGAYGARVIPGRNLATVTDGEGHVLLVDLSRLDERWDASGPIPPDALFSTVSKVLATDVTTPDPRIVWRSRDSLVTGTLAPVFHQRTGFVMAGKVLEKVTNVISAIDPKLRLVDVKRETELSAVVPSGIAPPPAFAGSSLSAFRLEIDLPGSINESLSGGELTFDIDSERILGAKTEDTPAGWPSAHIKGLKFRRVVPDSMPELRFQNGYNRWISDPVVAIADPRASKDYVWPSGSNKNAEGCYACDRPAEIATDPTLREIFSLGRYFRIRPNASAFAGTPYAYLADDTRRLEVVVPTIAADVIHSPAVLTAAQHPATAEGLLQGTTHLHSGELETSATDFDFGGRAGWNVSVDRTYRSRTIGLSPLGQGWDAAMFKRVRALPNGDAEFRDGTGEVWLFERQGDQYVAPLGLFLKLSKTDRGWSMIDQQLRLTNFDNLGRLASESDEFFDTKKPGSGNTIHYLYGSDGRLATIVDPVARKTTLKWNDATGLLEEIADWRSRKITYEYDTQRLQRVQLPDVANTSGARPTTVYGYQSGGTSFNDRVEIATNLTTIKDPKEAVSGGSPRVTFTYALSGEDRDRVIGQRWGSGETATLQYNLPTTVTVRDVLGQERRYTLTANDTSNLLADRAHVTGVRDVAVPVWSGATFGQLPSSLTPGAPSTGTTDRVRTFGFENGILKSSKLEGVRETILGYQPAAAALGVLMKSTTTTPLGVSAGGPSSIIPPSSPISRTFAYQPGSNFLAAIEAGGKKIESTEPHRKNTTPSTTNSEITSTRTFDPHGLLTDTTSAGGTDTASAGAKGKVEYFGDSAPLHARGLPHIIRQGEGADELKTAIEYPTETQTKETDPRGVIITTDVDAWERPVSVRVERPGDPLAIEETYRYDASGRLEEMTEKKGSDLVTTRYSYDVMGRRTSTTTNGIATVGSVTTTTAYNLGSRTITTTHAGGAITTTELDTLGRGKRSVTQTGSSPIEQQFAYDLAGNQVYVTDMLTASADAFDVHGRAVASRYADGTIATTEYDEWSRPKTVKNFTDDAASIVAESSYDFTAAGRAKSVTTKLDAGVDRTTLFAWDGGGRTTRTATNGRASATAFDVAGRMKTHAAGAGTVAALTEIFEKSEVKAHSGDLPIATESSEKSGATYTATMDRNTTGDVVRENVGPLDWQRTYDELGNVTQANVPGRPATNWKVDARGAVEKETLPDGAENTFAYHASGAQSAYTDPTSEATSTVTDLKGRPITSTYADGTTEKVEWEGSRVKSVTDRQNRKQTYVYNSKGQMTEIRDGASTLIDLLTYDNAGRLVSWKNADAEITWSEFDLDGNPKHTIQKRFKDASGLSSSAVVLDELAQDHRWNEHGDRVKFSMPAGSGVALGAGWTKWLRQSFDAMDNLTEISRIDSQTATAATPVMTASYRGAGRPDVRTLFAAANGAPIIRTYEYDPTSSLLSRLEASVNRVTIAGSEVAYDGLQISQARLLGISSGERFARHAYDDRSRLAASVYGTRNIIDPIVPVPGRARQHVNPADFRNAQERTPAIPPALPGAARVDPPTSTFDEKPGGGHKIANMTKGPLVLPFGYDGAERIDDGRFIYTFNAKGRLIRATEKATVPPIRRASYSYSGTGRLVGRRAEYATVAAPATSDWKLEDRAQIIRADGLPAETTFAWDPISDRLLAVYRAGAAGDPIKQIIHGDSAYDDPLETTTTDPLTGAITHLYPIYDEAAAGSLQAVLNERGELVVRNLTNDPYGADDLALTGAAIDGAKVKATKNASGVIETVEVTLHATEQLDASSIASGARLAVVDTTGVVVRTATVTPTLAATDPFAVLWTLTAADWNALVEPTPAVIGGAARMPSSLSIAATKDLRASAWSSTVPVMPAPEWAIASKPVYTSSDLPVEVRESLSSLASYLAGIPASEERTTTLYEVETLALLGVSGSDTPLEDVVSARMHAHPFTEPLMQLDYVRARWYQPLSGSWLSPDPLGYQDSSNLYAGFAGDPVNGRDPTGQCLGIDKAGRPCGDYARMLPDFLVETLGLNDLPSTGSKRIDKTIRRVAQAPARVAAVPATVLLTTGESTGEMGYRMERSTFHGEQALDPASVDDALLVAGVIGDVATVAAPLGMLEGGMPRATKAQAIGTAATPRNGNAPRVIADALDAQRVLANLTRQVNADLAANPALARSVLSRPEYEAAVASGRIAAAQYGNAVERLVAKQIRENPELANVFRRVGGPSNPDFTAFGRNFDITTETQAQVIRHMKRPGYGNDLIVVTYERPATFTTFPSQ